MVRVTITFLTLNITCFFVFGAFKVLSASYLEIHRMGVMALEGNPNTREAGAQCRHSELQNSLSYRVRHTPFPSTVRPTA